MRRQFRVIVALAGALLAFVSACLLRGGNWSNADLWPTLPLAAQSVTLPAQSEFKSHPLPSSLATWTSRIDRSDYFEALSAHRVGYLIWSDRPVSVYIAASHFTDPTRSQAWRQAVEAAVRDWQAYFPLTFSTDPQADIVIEQARPRKTSQGRIRSAQASPQAYCNGDRLAHRFTVQISPSQAGPYIESAVRHELGHALGLWGHSDNPKDVLYASQVRQPPPISERDINTLKKVYLQPTLLGWPAPQFCQAAAPLPKRPTSP